MSALDVQFTENKKESVWTVTLNLIKLQFVYTKKERLNQPISTLYCKIFLEKNSKMFFHIPQIIDYLNINDFHCYYFSFIENDDRMRACFDTISDFIYNNFKAVNELAMNGDKYNKLLLEELMHIADLTDKDFPDNSDEKNFFTEKLLDFVSKLQVNHYTRFEAYDYFLQGLYSKSLKSYEKSSKHTELLNYEKKLIDFIITIEDNETAFEAVAPECASMLEVKKYNGTSKADKLSMLLSFIICWVALTIPIVIIMIIVNHCYYSSTVLCDAVSTAYAPVISGLPAVFAGIAVVDKVQFLIHKDKSAAKDFSEILNPPKALSAAKIIAVILAAASLIFYAFVFQPYMKCYDGYMLVDNSEGLFQKYERYEYSDIKAIYHVRGRYNPFGDYIDRESYILCFDNDKIDTDAFAFSDEEIQNELLPLFDDYIDEIQNIKTERDIDWK
ncbi:MAG: hypothetical protein ACLUFN_04020 [Eubacterium sp.]